MSGAPMTVKVKPLVWEDWDGGMTVAATPWGKYNINSDLRLSLPTGAYRRYETELTAKAAAQADYTARILAALDLVPDPRVAALVEAARVMVAGYSTDDDRTIAGFYALQSAIAALEPPK